MKLLFPIAVAFVDLLSGVQDGRPPDIAFSPFTCNRLALDGAARQRHFEVLGPALRSMRRQVRELPNGFEFEFPATLASVLRVAEWSAGEHLCCPFFDIEMLFPRDGGGFWLRLTGRAGVKQFIKSDFERWLRR